MENGKKAYDELKNEHNDFDLVLLDLYMPEMDGFELLSLMQDDPRLREIPVVIMSASESSEIIANCLSKLYLIYMLALYLSFIIRDGSEELPCETYQN